MERINSTEDGRFYIRDLESGRLFLVEPIGPGRAADWGDLDPITKKLKGDYGQKHTGSVKESDSIITEENGFKNIIDLEPGESPLEAIEKLLK